MSGFCPDDWHGTTDEDVRQMMAGDDLYDFWFDPQAIRAARRAPVVQRAPINRRADPWFERDEDQ